jgi:hypothetical protein
MTRLPPLVLGLMLGGCLYESGSGGGSPTDGGSGRACGGFAGESCGSREFCDFGRNTCGASDEQGICRSRPNGCPDLFDPVCGCDQVVHSNECDAQAAGVDVNASGGCPVQAGEHACGFRTCQSETEYCQHGFSDIGGEPDSFTCKPLPVGCGTSPTCGCLAAEPCGAFCAEMPPGALTVRCPGG